MNVIPVCKTILFGSIFFLQRAAVGIEHNTVGNFSFEKLITLHGHLSQLASATNSSLEGNIADNVRQVRDYYDLVKAHKPQRICEIGFNAGHSASTFMYAFPSAEYIGFDLSSQVSDLNPLFTRLNVGNHSYTAECFRTIQRHIGSRKKSMRLIIGDSVRTVPTFASGSSNTEPCDFIHIDGGHFGDVPFIDIVNMIKLSRSDGKTTVIVDDSVCLLNRPSTGCYEPQIAWVVATIVGMIRQIKCTSFSQTRGYCVGKYTPHAAENISLVLKLFKLIGVKQRKTKRSRLFPSHSSNTVPLSRVVDLEVDGLKTSQNNVSSHSYASNDLELHAPVTHSDPAESDRIKSLLRKYHFEINRRIYLGADHAELTIAQLEGIAKARNWQDDMKVKANLLHSDSRRPPKLNRDELVEFLLSKLSSSPVDIHQN